MLIEVEYCEFARSQYNGLGQEQGVTALNGYFIIDRVRQSYVILRGIPIGELGFDKLEQCSL